MRSPERSEKQVAETELALRDPTELGGFVNDEQFGIVQQSLC